MSDIGWYLAGSLGFALACVIGVVYLLSKRQVHVHQENHNTAAPQIDVHPTGGGGGIAPVVVAWAFRILAIGLLLAVVANIAMSAVNGVGAGLKSIGDGLSRPAVTAPPVSQPVQVAPQVIAPQVTAPQAAAQQAAPVSALEVVLAVLGVALVIELAWVAKNSRRSHPRRVAKPIAPPVQASKPAPADTDDSRVPYIPDWLRPDFAPSREHRLNDILPDAVLSIGEDNNR